MKPDATQGARRARLLAALLCGLALLAQPARAAVKIFACTPEWASLSRELAGDLATVYTATTALQDPHQVQARPSLLAAVRQADLVVCTGAELEVGWLPLLLRQAGNARVQAGQPGHFEAAQFVKMLEVPARLDRADGDVHAAGNPHIQTAPGTFTAVAPPLSQRLSQLDPAHAADYQRRLLDFQSRWKAATERWTKQAAPLKGLPIVVKHRGFVYLEQWLGLVQVGTLEPRPGVEPSAAHLGAVLQQLQTRPARLVLRAAYHDPRSTQWLADRTGLPVVVLPFTVGGSERAADLFGLFDDTLDRLLTGAAAGARP